VSGAFSCRHGAAAVGVASVAGVLLPRTPLFGGAHSDCQGKGRDQRQRLSEESTKKETSQSNENGWPVSHGPLRIFAGNAHVALAQEICSGLQVELSKATVDRFACGEVNVVINESVRDCDVFVIQPTCSSGLGPQENLMELLVMLDAINRGAANRITAVIPSFGYARQNAKEQSRQPITAKLVTDLLQVAGADRVLTIELHSPQIQGFASYPIDNMYALPLLVREIKAIMKAKGITSKDIVVVSPDVGGTKRAAAFAKKLDAPLAIFSRQRRRPTGPKEVDLVGDVDGKMCIIVDGICDSAQTVVVAANSLKAKGASAVIGAVVHGILTDPACERIMKSEMEVLLCTDTVPLDGKVAMCPKIKIIHIAPVLAAAIKNIHTSKSLSILFDDEAPEETTAHV